VPQISFRSSEGPWHPVNDQIVLLAISFMTKLARSGPIQEAVEDPPLVKGELSQGQGVLVRLWIHQKLVQRSPNLIQQGDFELVQSRSFRINEQKRRQMDLTNSS
jgi:hypothetical protein